MNDQAIPYNGEAEQRLLGAMLWRPDARDVALARLAAVDFYEPTAARLFSVIGSLHDAGEAVTETTVLAWADAHPIIGIDVDRSYIADCANATAAAGWSSLAALIADAAARRRVIAASANLAAAAYDPAAELTEVATLAETLPEQVRFPATTVAPGPGIAEFLARSDDEPDWVIQGLLERTDRCIVTGWMEGGGKSTLQRQLAVQAAAGLVPFTSGAVADPMRVLIVDCENPEGIVRRKIRALVLSAGDDLDDPMRLVIHCRPEGLDLLQIRDRSWLAALIEANRPDVVMLGPLYKLHEDDPTAERPARALAAFLDRLRIRHRFALILEAHTPQDTAGIKRPLRPYGASLWRRWPELGFGIEREDDGVYHLRRWRDERDDRHWPSILVRGGLWPWGRGS